MQFSMPTGIPGLSLLACCLLMLRLPQLAVASGSVQTSILTHAAHHTSVPSEANLLIRTQSRKLRASNSKSSKSATDPAEPVHHLKDRKLQSIPAATGAFTSITIPLDYCGSASSNIGELADQIYGSDKSLKTFFQQCSFGKLTLDPSQNKILTTPVPIRGSDCNCNINSIGDAAEAYVQNKLNIDLSQYSIRIIVFPKGACGFYGMGAWGCFSNKPKANANANKCRTWVVDGFARQLMHEVGHNLGLGHSNLGGMESGDASCPMSNDGQYTCPNAYHSHMLGWTNPIQTLDAGQVSGGAWSNVRLPPRVSTDTNYLLLTGPGSDLYVSYISAIGWESGISSEYANKLVIHKERTPSDWSRSQRVALLSKGDTTTEPDTGYPRWVVRLGDDASVAGATAQVCLAKGSGDCQNPPGVNSSAGAAKKKNTGR